MKKKTIKNDYILIIAAAFLLILGGFVIFRFSYFEPRPELPPSPQIIGRAILTVDFGNGTKRAFEGEIIDNETIIGILMQASKAGSFYYKLDDKYNLAAIESYANGKNKSWQWYLNDKKINNSPGETIIKSGDNILIKYE